MKTIIKIKKEIAACIRIMLDCGLSPVDRKVYKRTDKKRAHLIKVLQYLESFPKKDFLEKEKLRLSNRITLLEEGVIRQERNLQLS